MDHYLDVEYNSHPVYRVEGKDVYMQLPVAPWEAALGATVTLPTPVSKLQLKIPAESSGGNKLRLKGQGIPAATPGDLFVILEVAVPHATSDDEKAIYRKMEQTFQFNPRKALGV